MSPAIILWGLGAGIPAVLAEYLYRTLQNPWHYYIWLWVPLQLGIGYCIYRMVTMPGATLLDAFIVWALATTVLRVLVTTVLLHDAVKWTTWAALALVLMANVVRTFGDKLWH